MEVKAVFMFYLGLALLISFSPGCKKKSKDEATGNVQLRMQEVH